MLCNIKLFKHLMQRGKLLENRDKAGDCPCRFVWIHMYIGLMPLPAHVQSFQVLHNGFWDQTGFRS